MMKRLLPVILYLCCVLDTNAQYSTGTVQSMVPDESVYAIAQHGDTLYVGGYFKNILAPKHNGIAVSAVTGLSDLNYVSPNGTVYACVSDGVGGWFIGGDFTAVGGVPRNRLARINADGSLNSWNPDVTVPNWDSRVTCLLLHNGIVYAGGQFTAVGGQTRNNICAIDVNTGIPTAWNPNVDYSTIYGTPFKGVYSITTDGVDLYIAGFFNSVGGLNRQSVAAVSLQTGMPTGLNASFFLSSSYAAVTAIAVYGNNVYVGGQFNKVNLSNINYMAALDKNTGATMFGLNCNASVGTLYIYNDKLYIGGDFSIINNITRYGIAEFDLITSAITSWDPNNNGIGLVSSISVAGSRLYAGGYIITSAGHINMIAIDIANATILPWTSNTNYPVASVLTVAAQANSVYIGGAFSRSGGQIRKGLAAINIKTGYVTDWNPNVDGTVNTIEIYGSTLYAGGNFNNASGQPRSKLAAWDLTTNTLLPWNPGANGTVYSLQSDGSTVYAGGDFGALGGQTRSYIGALNATTGFATPWAPNAFATVRALALQGNKVYAGGDFTNIGGQPRNRIAALNASSGLATTWNPNANDKVYTIAIDGNNVYAGGQFTNIGGQTRNRLAALNITNGLATAWNPSADDKVSSIIPTSNAIYVGGYFTSIGGSTRNKMAAINAISGVANTWNVPVIGSPNYYGTNAILVTGDTVYSGGIYNNNVFEYLIVTTDSAYGPPSVSIAAANTTLCAGAPANFIATVGNAGATPAYQWMKGSQPVIGATDATYTDTAVGSGGQYNLVVTSSGQGSQQGTSNTVTISINTANNWTGAAGNSLWSDPANWSCGVVPNDQMNVTIPPNTVLVIDTPNATALDMTLGAGSMLYYSGTAPLLHVVGSLNSNGSVSTCGGTLQVDNP